MKENELLKLEIENLNNELNLVKNNYLSNKIFNDFDYLEENIFHNNTFKKYIRKLFFDKDKFCKNDKISGPYRYGVNFEKKHIDLFKDDYYFFKIGDYYNLINHKRYVFEISSIINTKNYKNNKSILSPTFKKNLEELYNVKIKKDGSIISIINNSNKKDWRDIIKNFINVKLEIYNELIKSFEKIEKYSIILKNIFEYEKIYSYYRGYQEDYIDYNSDDQESWYYNCYRINPKENKDLNKYLKYSKLPLISKFSLDSKDIIKNCIDIQVHNYLKKNKNFRIPNDQDRWGNKFNNKENKIVDLYKANNTLLNPSDKIKFGLDSKLECDIICIYKNEIKFLNNFNIIHKFNFPKDNNITNISILENDNFLIELNNNGILYELNIFTKKINLFFCKTEVTFD